MNEADLILMLVFAFGVASGYLFGRQVGKIAGWREANEMVRESRGQAMGHVVTAEDLRKKWASVDPWRRRG